MNMEQMPRGGNLPVMLTGDATLTMSSREIASLCEKDHKHVRRDIKAMLGQLGGNDGEYVQLWTHPQNGQTYAEYQLPKDLTLTLIAGYNVTLRKRIINRWLELEEQTRPAAIDVRNPNQLALIASQLIEVTQEQAKQIEAMREEVEAHDRLTRAEGSLCITDAAKALQMRPKDLFGWLRENGWIFRRAGAAHDLGYQSKTAAGLLEHKVTTVLRADGSEKVTEQVRVTPRGLSKLAKLIQPAAQLIGGGK